MKIGILVRAETEMPDVPLLTLEEHRITSPTTTINVENSIVGDLDINIAIEELITIEYELASIRKYCEKGELSTEHYIDKLDTIRNSAEILVGSDSALVGLTTELVDMVDGNIKLSIEEFNTNRRSILDDLTSTLWDQLDQLLNKDTWKSIPGSIKSTIILDKSKISLINKLLQELKTGVRVMRDVPKPSDSLLRLLGVYSLRSATFTIGDFIKHSKEYNNLYTSGLLDGVIDGVYDSLVQSVDLEIRLDKYKPSIKYVESLKRLDRKLVYKDTKIMIPTPGIGSVLNVIQIVQGTKPVPGVKYLINAFKKGMNVHTDSVVIDNSLYNNIKMGHATEKDLYALGKYFISTAQVTSKINNVMANKKRANVFLRDLRSMLATVFYASNFVLGILALKRFIRQIFIATRFNLALSKTAITTYQSTSVCLDATIDIIDAYTIKK